jgi:hypothetical protein
MMSQGKTPWKDPKADYRDLRGLSKASFTWKDSSDPCNPPPPWGLSKGSFSGTLLTVHSVHHCTCAFSNRAVICMHLCFCKTLSQNCPLGEIRLILALTLQPLVNPGHHLVSPYSQNLIFGTGVVMNFQSYQCSLSN